MIRANFPRNDLLRRRLQTSLTITTLALSVASTLFLLLFTNRLTLNSTSVSGTLTMGISTIFSNLTFFVGLLIFVIGAVLTSFTAFLTMAQRTRDIGLIKAAGCPNGLLAGYFTTELLETSLAGCILGVGLGFLMYLGISYAVFSGYRPTNFWFAPLVFVTFLVLAMFFGLRPVSKAAKMPPMRALSPTEYYGLTVGHKRKSKSKWGTTLRVALRSLYRRQSATLRIMFLLSIVFVLLTISVAGGIIARDTTMSWVQGTTKTNTIAVATNSMGIQYKQLLSSFTGDPINSNFNYSDPNLAIPQQAITQISALPSVSLVDSRLVLNESVKEIGNVTYGESSGDLSFVGGNRQGNSIVIGVNAPELDGSWYVNGQFLTANDSLQAVVGDSIAQTMYSPNESAGIGNANPLDEGIAIQNNTYDIVGQCVDPINNGFVTYVPIEQLLNKHRRNRSKPAFDPA